MRSDIKLELAAAVCAAAGIALFAGLARAEGPAPCEQQGNLQRYSAAPAGHAEAIAFAWASSTPSNATAFAWASVTPVADKRHDCPCGPDCPCGDNCQCSKDRVKPAPPTEQRVVDNSRGLYWSREGVELRLIEPGKCPLGKPCNTWRVIGGFNGEYRPWDGLKWGPVCEPPIPLPKLPFDEAARMIAAGLVAAIAEDDCSGPNCPNCPPATPQRSAFYSTGGFPAYSGGGSLTTVTSSYSEVSADSFFAARSGPLRRLLTAPSRAIGAARANRTKFEPVQSAPANVALPMQTQIIQAGRPTLITYGWQKSGEYELKAVTESVPVTRYQWALKTSEQKAPATMPKGDATKK